ncbi:MAG: Crp/Fnr family transcriptional regulator [Acidobacteriaceae bacterium]
METKRISALQRTVLFGGMTAEELLDLAQQAVDLHFSKGEMLFLSGEPVKGLFVVVSGKIRVFQHNAEGREQVMHIDTAGSVIADVAVFDGGPYPASAIAVADAEVLFIDKRDVDQCCILHPSFVLRALKLMAQRVRRHAQLAEALSLHDVGQRLALFLLAEAQSANAPRQGAVSLHLPLSNHEIAIRIGSVRDVVSRAFAKLKHDGLIAVEDHEFTIVDVPALKLYAANGGASSLRKTHARNQ